MAGMHLSLTPRVALPPHHPCPCPPTPPLFPPFQLSGNLVRNVLKCFGAEVVSSGGREASVLRGEMAARLAKQAKQARSGHLAIWREGTVD